MGAAAGDEDRVSQPCFPDSERRLDWVERLVHRARAHLDSVEQQREELRVAVERREKGGFVHARLIASPPVDVPEDLGFLLADIAVNARSCLDMAVTRIAELSGASVRNPQFPILDDVEEWEGSRAANALEKGLPAPVVQALKALQPVHDSEEFGYLEIPLNLMALIVRELANANKHRTVTQALDLAMSWGIRPGALPLDVVDADDSAWAPDGRGLLELRFPEDRAIDDAELVSAAYVNFDLRVLGSGFHYGGDERELVRNGLDIPIPVAGFLRDAVPYVRHVLDALEFAVTGGRRGRPPSPYTEWWVSYG